MTLQDLPQRVRERLFAERLTLKEAWHRNDAYHVCVVNEDGTRYFSADRTQMAWSDNKGNYLPFGGGSMWRISYGAIQFGRTRNPIGEIDYVWTTGKRYGKSLNGTIIPNTLSTKKEVIELINKIGIFNL